MKTRLETPALHRQLMEYDERLGYRFAPSLRVRIPHEGGGYLVKTNRDGFRSDHAFTLKRNRGQRLLLFGDSYTAGDGVSNGKRYSDILEQCLEDTEILNFGLSGSGTDQQYLVYRQYADMLEYDAVVIGVLVENIRRNTVVYREWSGRSGGSICVPKPWFELSSNGELTLNGVPVRPPYEMPQDLNARSAKEAVMRSARRMINSLGPNFKDWFQRVTRFQPLPEYNSADDYGWRLMRAILTKWVAEIRVPLVIAVIPVYQYVEETAAYKNVRARFDELARASGALVYHVVDDMLPYPREVRRSFRFRGDCHFTPLGHKVVGEAMAKIVAPLMSNDAARSRRMQSVASSDTQPGGGEGLSGMNYPIQPQA
ncbi:MAG TPA: SGNH/GDSL hydrolase family protein [Trinickia sp.]|jgi:hypothetical protein|uniref:SGNH/GDSL hydrolase family protein n=1 Tax=Trinickia sp. TaxID=2571163 RepID=UPI002BB007D8|nr:SGNH/GDSL hydrolase family protein [Trinickia sp.]HTI18561.1 SGNH/GDSL hydrolase family protein [Trinickia sp.]